jgi:hypothetical protein
MTSVGEVYRQRSNNLDAQKVNIGDLYLVNYLYIHRLISLKV